MQDRKQELQYAIAHIVKTLRKNLLLKALMKLEWENRFGLI